MVIPQKLTEVWHKITAWMGWQPQIYPELPPVSPELPPLPPPSFVAPPPPPKEKKLELETDPHKAEEYGRFYFKDTILDKLDEYFVIMRRMKKSDRQSYQMFSRIGFGLQPTANISRNLDNFELKVSPWFLEEMPGLGGTAFGIDKSLPHGEKDEEGVRGWWPRFTYFRKYSKDHQPRAIQRTTGGVVYMMTLYWDYLNKGEGFPRSGAPWEIPIVVMENGEIIPLKLRAGKKTVFRYEGMIHSGREWDFPSDYYIWARRFKMTPEQHIALLFKMCTDDYESNQSAMMKIIVTKEHLTATFGIEVKRSAYFFKDREVILNEAGHKKRIFHIVRPHTRSTGKSVKMHFRGLREFMWNGYKINITVPGKIGGDITEWDVGVADEETLKPGEGAPFEKYGKQLKTFMITGDYKSIKPIEKQE